MARQVVEETRTVTDDVDNGVRDMATAPVERADRASVAERIVYLIGGVLLSLLAIRFLLSLLGANRENGFADFIYTVTHPFVSPFFGLFGYDMQYGVSRFEIETVIAILVYALLIALIARIATVTRR